MRTKIFLAMLLVVALAGTVGCACSCADRENTDTVDATKEEDTMTNPSQDENDFYAAATPEEKSAAYRTAADAGNAFAFDLFGELYDSETNLFFSPASIAIALTMTWAGAEGPTAEEMADVLHLAGEQQAVHLGFAQLQDMLNEPDAAHTLRVANRLWGQTDFDFLDSFLKLIKHNYGGGLETLDFRLQPEPSRKIINDWVADQTEQKIQNLLPKGVIDPLTRLVLTNAVYFLANWEHAFPTEATTDQDFRLTSGQTVSLPTMKLEKHLPYAENETWQVLTLPYEGGELEFVVLLPKDETEGRDPVKTLTDQGLSTLLSQRRGRQVSCWLPGFKLETSFALVEPLKDLGMKTAFDRNDADFSGMTGRPDLFISAVVHKAFIKVDEKGTEAAAATGVVVSLKSSLPPKPVEFRADHPFVFMIRHIESDSILFMGRCADPRG